MAAVVDSWQAWTQRFTLTSTTANQEDKHAHNVVGRSSKETLQSPEERLFTSSGYDGTQKTDCKLAPGTPSSSSRFGLRSSATSSIFRTENPSSADDYPDFPPACQLNSSLPPLSQKHPFPSLQSPSLPQTPMLMIASAASSLRRANKLRKSNRPTIAPPTLAPLSFIEEPDFDFDFEHISDDVQQNLLHTLAQQSLTYPSNPQQDIPSAEICEQISSSSTSSRRLTKRRPSPPPILQTQIVPSSSGAAAAAAVTGNPSALVATPHQISSHTHPFPPHRAQSDAGHGPRSSLSIKQSNIIRRLSMRTPKRRSDASAHTVSMSSGTSSSAGDASPSSVSTRRWSKWLSSASESGCQDVTSKDEAPVFLPLVRVTSPLKITIPFEEIDQDQVTRGIIPRQTHVATDLSFSTPSQAEPCSSTSLDPSDSSKSFFPDILRPRPKFTLEANESDIELSNPPSGQTTPTRSVLHSQSAPPSRTNSAYSPQYLSPLGRHERVHQQPLRRRWTFAMAMTNEEITDEVLVEELERMRLLKEWSGSVDEVEEMWDTEREPIGYPQPLSGPSLHGVPQQHLEQINRGLRHSLPQADISYTPSLPSFPHQYRNSAPPSGSGSTQHWQIARRALLTCRELVRTERHYLSSLQALLASETETAPPLLMLRYAEELAKASKLYLAQMEENPSAWGVAAAFVGVEEAVDSAFVGWCGVVGTWFDGHQGLPNDPSAPGKKLSKQRLVDDDHKVKKEREDESSPIKRTVNSWRRSMTNITDVSMTMAMNSPQKKKEKGLPPPPSFTLNGDAQQRRGKHRKQPLRDLAILPTQRIMRYVLLYRDLLTHTPSTSPSLPLIKRAADAALRIAQKCDRAQNNSAFIIDRRSTPASSLDKPPAESASGAQTVDIGNPGRLPSALIRGPLPLTPDNPLG